MAAPTSILVIEDEPHMRTLLGVTLKQHGYECTHASTGAEGIAAAQRNPPDVVLLDLGLPDLDGVEVATRIRQRSRVPIIVISARGREEDKIAALDGGASDYVTKPFGAGELLARIRVAIRDFSRAEVVDTGTVRIGDLVVDFDMREVTIGGVPVHLTPTEYRLLSVMVRSAGRVVTHRQILREVWGPGSESQGHYLRVYMKQLRYKIEPEPAQPKYLINEPGVGYRLRMQPTDAR